MEVGVSALQIQIVTSRKGRVSRNGVNTDQNAIVYRHVPQGACE